MTQFIAGADPRRNTQGRPPTPASLRRRVRQILGRDIDDLLTTIRISAVGGDPDSQAVMAELLAAAMIEDPKACRSGLSDNT